MQPRSLSISATLHVLVFILATVSMPWLHKDFVIPQPISVELVDIAPVTQTTKVAPQPKPPEKKEEKPPIDKPPPAATNTSDQPVVPVKDDKKEDKPEPKKDEVLVDKNAPPEKKKTKSEEKKKETTEEKPKDFASVLKNLDVQDQKDKSRQPDLKLDEKAAAAPDGQNAPLGEKMTMSEEDALRQQLERCWNVPFGAKDAENLVVEVFMVINPDRTLQTARVVDTARYNSDTFFRAAADSAVRAVHSPLCSPFDLPPDKYDVWKTVTVTFNPSDMF